MAYLCVGLLLGPMFLGLLAFDLLQQAPLLATMMEIAVLISLFSAGVKMPVPFSLTRWLPSLRLTWLSMPTWLHARGFWAVFFADVALRQTELPLAGAPKDQQGLLQAEETHAVSASEVPLTVGGESLVFKEHLERLSELPLVLLLGGTVTAAAWSWQAWSVALFLLLARTPPCWNATGAINWCK